MIGYEWWLPCFMEDVSMFLEFGNYANCVKSFRFFYFYFNFKEGVLADMKFYTDGMIWMSETVSPCKTGDPESCFFALQWLGIEYVGFHSKRSSIIIKVFLKKVWMIEVNMEGYKIAM